MTNTPSISSIEDQLQNFVELSAHLLTLIQHENSILAEMGEFTFETYVQKKVEHMREFEKQAQFLLLQITEAGSIGSTVDKAKSVQSRLLMAEIKKIRDVLTINSAYQMDVIKDRTKARQEKFSAPLPIMGEPKKEFKTCH